VERLCHRARGVCERVPFSHSWCYATVYRSYGALRFLSDSVGQARKIAVKSPSRLRPIPLNSANRIAFLLLHERADCIVPSFKTHVLGEHD